MGSDERKKEISITKKECKDFFFRWLTWQSDKIYYICTPRLSAFSMIMEINIFYYFGFKKNE